MLYKISYIHQQKSNTNPNITIKAENKEKVSTPAKEYTKPNTSQQNTVSEPAPSQIKKESVASKPETEKTKTTSGFSIKQNLQNNSEIKSATTHTSKEIQEDKDFTADNAQQTWNDFLTNKLSDVRLKNFYAQNPQNVYWKDKTFVFKVLNKSQELEIRKIHDELLFFFKQNLKNSTIKIEIEHSDEEVTTKRPYTAKEKYQYFSEKYPVLNQIKEQLDLDFQ